MELAREAECRAVRSVTILGATGSIGSSTVDLLKRQHGAFRVEALTAHKNGVALAKLARELGARFAAVADHERLRRTQVGAFGHAASRPQPGPMRVAEAARRPAEWVIGAITGAAGLSRRSRRSSAARRSRSPTRNASSAPARCSCAARSETGATVLPVDQRAQRAVPGADRRPARGRHQGHHHRLGRAVPHLVEGRHPQGDAAGGAQASRTGRWARRSRSIPRP